MTLLLNVPNKLRREYFVVSSQIFGVTCWPNKGLIVTFPQCTINCKSSLWRTEKHDTTVFFWGKDGLALSNQLQKFFTHEVGSRVSGNLNVIEHNKVGSTAGDLTRNSDTFNRRRLSGSAARNVKRDTRPSLVIVHRAKMSQPIELKNTFLTEDCKVISPLFGCGNNKNLFIAVIPQGPQHKGSCNPGLTQTTKRLDLESFGTVL